ncbi:MAG: putative metal-dependent membrane protease [Phormidesmis priestleyi Ana]|uniref:Putative metal-dependent membrane protease n=1 Tax=Phormidesmis priestleyi Ana TaxID=1666911 RepID=A0A0P7ZIW9_9CYAN|nr:MAG: putative metal-dependent membrane protease [Phormidesmis priestleyi Ana]
MSKFFKRVQNQNKKAAQPKRKRVEPEITETEQLDRSQLLVAMAVTALILLLVARLWLFFEPLQLSAAIVWHDAGIGLIVGLAISAVSAAIYRLWPAYQKSADFYLNFVLAPLTLSDSIWVGLLPGMSEELLFRGVMLPAIGLNATGLLVSSLCFGVLHMSSWRQWPYAIWATCIGLVLGFSALATHNLLVPVVAHITTNLVSSLFWQYQNRPIDR